MAAGGACGAGAKEPGKMDRTDGWRGGRGPAWEGKSEEGGLAGMGTASASGGLGLEREWRVGLSPVSLSPTPSLSSHPFPSVSFLLCACCHLLVPLSHWLCPCFFVHPEHLWDSQRGQTSFRGGRTPSESPLCLLSPTPASPALPCGPVSAVSPVPPLLPLLFPFLSSPVSTSSSLFLPHTDFHTISCGPRGAKGFPWLALRGAGLSSPC